MEYYLDIETTGLNPKENKIITIQYQEMPFGKPRGELIILKEWESSEEDIVKKFYNIFITKNPFGFIPILQNFLFDFRFLIEKFKKYKLPIKEDILEFLYEKPFIDIKNILILMNNLSFSGSGLDKMTNKERNGDIIPQWYSEKKYDLIEDYIKQETLSFFQAFQVIYKNLTSFKLR